MTSRAAPCATIAAGSSVPSTIMVLPFKKKIRKYARVGLPLIAAQGLVSLTGILTNILIARNLPHEAFGVFSLYYTTILVIGGLQVSLLTMPTSVYFADHTGERQRAYFGAQVRLQVLLSVIQVVLVAVACWVIFVSDALGLAALAFSLLFFNLYQLCRTIFLAESKIWGLLSLELFVTALRISLLLGVIYGGWLSPELAIALIGLSCALALLVAGRAPLTYVRFSLPLRPVARQNWRFGRWVLWEALALGVSQQAYVYFTALWLDQRAVAGLTAAQTLVNAINVILVGISSYALPRAKGSLVKNGFDAWRRELIFMGGGVLIASSVMLSAIYFFGAFLLKSIFGVDYEAYAAILPFLCISAVLSIVNSFLAIAFRSSQLPKAGFFARAASALLSVVLSYPLLNAFGLVGAAIGLLITQIVWTVVYVEYIRRGALDRERVLARTGMNHAGG